MKKIFRDALDSLSRSLWVGHPFGSALEIVAEECEPPVSTGNAPNRRGGRGGTSWKLRYMNPSERVPPLEVSLFAAGAQLQTRTGGKLNEVLGKLAKDMRESIALKGEVRALAAHCKPTGVVLSVLPGAYCRRDGTPASPWYLAVLIHHPNGKIFPPLRSRPR